MLNKIKCPYCIEKDYELPNGLCVYHNYFFGQEPKRKLIFCYSGKAKKLLALCQNFKKYNKS